MIHTKWKARQLRATAARAFGRRKRVTFIQHPTHVEVIESNFTTTRAGFKSLLSQGYVRVVENQDNSVVCERETRYALTYERNRFDSR